MLRTVLAASMVIAAAIVVAGKTPVGAAEFNQATSATIAQASAQTVTGQNPGVAAKPVKVSPQGAGATASTVATRVSSLIAGTIAGTAICTARRIKLETILSTQELVADSKHKWAYYVAAPLGLCGGIVSGIAQGPIFGPMHAWKYCDQPFSKEEFSLGDAK